MKKIIILLFAFFVQYPSSAQKFRDKFEYKVTYELTYKLDSTKLDEKKSEYMILFMGDELSIFSSRAKTLTHRYVIKGNMGHTSRAAITQFQYLIVKNPETGKIYYTLQIPKTSDRFYYVQDKNLFDWKISPETKMIGDYKAQKATTTFAGRDYVAWFTPEVPIPEGPYKFNGLPGLILEIADTENHWDFEFVGLEKISPPARFKINLKHYLKTGKEELLHIFREYRKDPQGYAWAQGLSQNVTRIPEVHREQVRLFTKMVEQENNPLELE